MMTRELATVDASPADAPAAAAPPAANVAAPDASGSGARAAGDPADTRKPPFRAAAPLPTQTAPLGVRFDFNDGCRIILPKAPETTWHVRLADLSTGNVLFETTIEAGTVASSKKYFVPFSIEVEANGKRVFEHRFDATNKPVLVEFPVGTLGDIIGWFPYAVKFQRQHKCKLTCSMGPLLIPLFRDCYPDIEFVTPEEVEPERYYASYRVGLFFGDEANVHQPTDFQIVGLHRTAGYILGVDPAEEPPKIGSPDTESRPIAEKYVCVAVQSSTQCKYWNHPPGWRELVAFLKQHGYRVICIDQKATHGAGMVWNHIPHGAEDHTGDRPLTERAALAKTRRIFRWTVERAVMACLGSGHAGCHDQRFHPPNQRVCDAVPRNQLSHLQQLLERRTGAVRSQGLPVVPASCRHAAPIRMYAAHYDRAGQAGDPADTGVRRTGCERCRALNRCMR